MSDNDNSESLVITITSFQARSIKSGAGDANENNGERNIAAGGLSPREKNREKKKGNDFPGGGRTSRQIFAPRVHSSSSSRGYVSRIR